MSRIGEGAALAPAGVVSTTGNTTTNVAESVQLPAQDLASADLFEAKAQQGIVAGGCIPPRSFPLPFPLPFPMPQPFPLPFPLPEPHPLPLPFPLPHPCPRPRDASADAALKGLDQKPAPISGEDMASAIQKGTEDLDGQAAGQEYRQFAEWARQNQDKLSPEAKEVLKVYEQAAKKAQAQGQTGISQADYQKMLGDMKKAATTDVSAKKALDALSKGDGKISGEDMTRAIENGTKDLDNQSAGREFDQFAKWAEQHPDRLSPEAKKVLDIYKKYAGAARAKGQTGMSQADYQKMLGEMKEVKTYKDEGAGKALDQLNHTKGPVSGQQMLDAIRQGTQDPDGQAAGNEMQDFIAWARDNASRLTPEAKKMVAIYMKYATQAVLQGQTGISQGDYQKMLAEMKAALQPPPRPIAA